MDITGVIYSAVASTIDVVTGAELEQAALLLGGSTLVVAVVVLVAGYRRHHHR